MSIARFASKTFAAVAPRASPVAVRLMSGDVNKDRESAFERDFVSKHERELLRGLVSKINKASDPTQGEAKASLNEILKAHKITPEPSLVTALLKWGHH